jgi:hypothetical protein
VVAVFCLVAILHHGAIAATPGVEIPERYQAVIAALLTDPDGAALLDVLQAIQRNAATTDADPSQAYQGALRGAIDGLRDPAWVYRTATEVDGGWTEALPAAIESESAGDIAVVRITSFDTRDVGDLFAEALEIHLQPPVRALVLDLRGNPGGLVFGGLRILDVFLADVVLGYRTDRFGALPLAFASPRAIATPLAVLIDADTASTAEIVAGVLQFYGRARLYGRESAGKSLGQTTMALPNGGELRMPSFRWLLPDGRDVGGIGLTPDVVIDGAAQTPLDTTAVIREAALDPALAAALRDLRAALGDELLPPTGP